MLKFFEGLHDGNLSQIGLQPKLCPAGIVTIGWGHAVTDQSGQFLKGRVGLGKLSKLYPHLLNIDIEKADKLLSQDLIQFEDSVNSLNLNLNQAQFDALVDFTYNLGFGNLLKSTLLRRIQNNEPNIREAFMLWNKANGLVLPGLVKRRSAEAELFLTGKLII